MAELKKVKTRYISLLHDNYTPTNEEDLIIKSKDGLMKNTMEVVKADEIKGLITCVVMKANYVDTQGDWYSNETVDEAQAWHMNNIINEGKNEPSDTNHNFEIAKGVKLKESWVDKGENYIWYAVLDSSDNSDLLEKAKLGTLTGVSIAGQAEKIEKSNDKSMIKSIIDGIKEYLKPKEIIKSEEIEMTKEELIALLDEKLQGYAKIEVKEEPKEEVETEKAKETPTETPEKEAPTEEPDKIAEMQKAFDTKLEEMQKGFDKKIEEVAKGRVTGEEEAKPTINSMSDEQLGELRKADPKGWQEMIKNEAKKIKNK